MIIALLKMPKSGFFNENLDGFYFGILSGITMICN